MNLHEAAKHLIESKAFKEIAKDRESGNSYRQFKSRFEKGELKEGAIVIMLLKHGYSIRVTKPK